MCQRRFLESLDFHSAGFACFSLRLSLHPCPPYLSAPVCAGRRNQQLEILFSELEECLPSHCETENEAETRAALSVINRTLSGLRAEQRALFIRRYYLSESIKEIAVFYQISETKVKQTLFRIRKKMKEELMKEGISI